MILPNRGILALVGADRVDFLNGLVTNTVGAAPAYACLLTAQGRFLHDFFVVPEGERLLIDCEADRREDLMARLKRFRLRAQVEIVDDTGKTNVVFKDPRHPDLGERNQDSAEAYEAWDRKRIMLGIPDGSRDMVVEEALLLENNIDRLNGIDWNKGCYIGQELTARMHYKSGVKRRLTPVRIEGPAPAAGAAIFSRGLQVGQMRSSCGDVGLALVRVDADASALTCDDTGLYPIPV